MEPGFKHQLGLVCVILLFPALCNCQEYFPNSGATYNGGPVDSWNPMGACGFGEYGRRVNSGIIAAVSGPLWRNGASCGTCYQIQLRCKKTSKCCNENGVHVVVTEHAHKERSNFTLSPSALARLVPRTCIRPLFVLGNIELKRVPCRYPGNIKLHVQESSNNPGYFAVVILDVNGIRDITAIEMWQQREQRWEPLRRLYGAVFDFVEAPSGDMRLRFQVGETGGENSKHWLQPKIPIPANWKPGATYDTKVQLHY